MLVRSVSWWLLSAALLLVISAGCRRTTVEEQVVAQLSDYAELKLTFKTQDERLQEELARVQAEKGLPLQMQEVEDRVEPGLDLSAVFFDSFDSDWQLQSVNSSLSELWPQKNLDFGDGLSKARSIVASHRARRETMRAALRQPGSRFRLDFTQGVAADTRWMTAAEVLAKMEAVEVVRGVSSQKPNSAIEPLSTIFRLAFKLGESPQLLTRLLAVDVRRIGLQALQRIATSKHATAETRQLLLELLDEQISHWPDESAAWKGDRAIGLHVYEMVRAGEYLSLLTPDEITALENKRETIDRAYVVQMNVESDERYYLETMRNVLRLCEQPFFERRGTWDEQFDELDEWRGGHEFPRVAADMMLPAFTTAQERIARDRTRCDAWRMALAASLEKTNRRKAINEVTGEALMISGQDVGIIRVLGLDGEDEELAPVLYPPAKD